jgi:hypothetical protein
MSFNYNLPPENETKEIKSANLNAYFDALVYALTQTRLNFTNFQDGVLTTAQFATDIADGTTVTLDTSSGKLKMNPAAAIVDRLKLATFDTSEQGSYGKMLGGNAGLEKIDNDATDRWIHCRVPAGRNYLLFLAPEPGPFPNVQSVILDNTGEDVGPVTFNASELKMYHSSSYGASQTFQLYEVSGASPQVVQQFNSASAQVATGAGSMATYLPGGCFKWFVNKAALTTTKDFYVFRLDVGAISLSAPFNTDSSLFALYNLVAIPL